MDRIGLVGFIGSGKGTVSSILEEKGYTHLSFAGALKDVLSVVFGWDRNLLEGDTIESRDFRNTIDDWWSNKLDISGFTPRMALQLIGTDLFRNKFHSDIWVTILERKILNVNGPVVVSDCRFPNELDLLKRLDFSIAHIKKGSDPSWLPTAISANLGSIPDRELMKRKYRHIHESEWAWIGYPVDDIIHNSGTIKELKGKITEWITKS